MRRRNYISTIAVLGLSGCIKTPETTSTRTPTDTPTDTRVPARIVDYTFEKVKSSKTPNGANVTSLGEENVVIEGTVSVSNGCKTITLSGEPRVSSGKIEAMIGVKRKEDAGDMLCTQAIESIGYRLSISFSDPSDELTSAKIAHGGVESGVFELELVRSDA